MIGRNDGFGDGIAALADHSLLDDDEAQLVHHRGHVLGTDGAPEVVLLLKGDGMHVYDELFHTGVERGVGAGRKDIIDLEKAHNVREEFERLLIVIEVGREEQVEVELYFRVDLSNLTVDLLYCRELALEDTVLLYIDQRQYERIVGVFDGAAILAYNCRELDGIIVLVPHIEFQIGIDLVA